MRLVLLADDGTTLRTFRVVENSLDDTKFFLRLVRDIFEAIDYFISE